MPPPRIPTLFSRLRVSRTSFRQPLPRRYTSISTSANTSPKPLTKTGLLLRFGGLLIAFHVVSKYFYRISRTDGISMLPTIPHSYAFFKPYILISNLYRRGRNVRVGDVVIYTHPMIPGMHGAKRIIGMPGDFVCIVTPGKRSEKDEGEFATVKEQMFQVPEGHCWLAGDNLDWSRDSRILGPVPLALVEGKVLAVLWPVGAFKWFGEGVKEVSEVEPEWIAA